MLAKIADYGVSLTKAGLPQITVRFTAEDGQSLTWWGSLKEGMPQEITLKTLFTMGFSADSLEPLAKGIEGGALNHLQDYELVTEKRPDQNGKERVNIKFINLPGSNVIRNKLDENDAMKALAGVNVKGNIAAMKQEMGVKSQEDVPF